MDKQSESARIRRTLGHPVIDADGHMIELEPLYEDYIRREGGERVLKECRAIATTGFQRWYDLSPEERRHHRITRPPWGLHTRNTLDVATVMLPKLFHDRLEEAGIDFAVVYPTLGLAMTRMADEEARRLSCRAMNRYYADTFRDYSRRLTPAALIPMYSPAEAIDELEFVVKELGLKVAVIANATPRPIGAAAAQLPADATHRPFWLDCYGLDSEYDYDPFWAKCVELGVSPTGHMAGHWGTRASISNYVHNHLGLFAEANNALCRSLLLGGVTRRFPQLAVGLLEGGVGWGCGLFADVIEHWEKRNRAKVDDYAFSAMDQPLLRKLWREFGEAALQPKVDGAIEEQCKLLYNISGWRTQAPEDLDEWRHCKIERKEDIADLFIPHFFFGCEGDDRMVSWAFNRKVNPFGVELKAMFGSDIGHWDVENIRDVLADTFKLVKKGLLTEENFRDFVFTNPVTLHTRNNPNFFKGTAVESEVDQLLRTQRASGKSAS